MCYKKEDKKRTADVRRRSNDDDGQTSRLPSRVREIRSVLGGRPKRLKACVKRDCSLISQNINPLTSQLSSLSTNRAGLQAEPNFPCFRTPPSTINSLTTS